MFQQNKAQGSETICLRKSRQKKKKNEKKFMQPGTARIVSMEIEQKVKYHKHRALCAKKIKEKAEVHSTWHIKYL